MKMVLIRYSNGTIRQAVLMAVRGNEIRVAVKGADDALLIRLLPEGWVTEDCEIVKFEFPTAACEAIQTVTASEIPAPEPLFQEWHADTTTAFVN